MTEVSSVSKGSVTGVREIQTSNPRVTRSPDVAALSPDQDATGAVQTGNGDSRNTKISDTDVNELIQEMKDVAAQHNVNLDFSVHGSTGEIVVKVVDAATQKVVRQLPPEELLHLHDAMEELAGYLLNAKV